MKNWIKLTGLSGLQVYVRPERYCEMVQLTDGTCLFTGDADGRGGLFMTKVKETPEQIDELETQMNTVTEILSSPVYPGPTTPPFSGVASAANSVESANNG